MVEIEHCAKQIWKLLYTIEETRILFFSEGITEIYEQDYMVLRVRRTFLGLTSGIKLELRKKDFVPS